MGQIRDFFRLDFSTFCEIWFEKVPDLSHLRPIWPTLVPKWVRLPQNGINLGLFRLVSQNVQKSYLKKSRICPILGQTDLFLSQTWHPWRALLTLECGVTSRPHMHRDLCDLCDLRVQFSCQSDTQARDYIFGINMAILTQIWQIWDFVRSVVITFWLSEPNCTENWSRKVPLFVPFDVYLVHLLP